MQATFHSPARNQISWKIFCTIDSQSVVGAVREEGRELSEVSTKLIFNLIGTIG